MSNSFFGTVRIFNNEEDGALLFPVRRGATPEKSVPLSILLDKGVSLCYICHVMKKRMTTAEAARAVGIARYTLQRWIKEGRIKPPKPVLRNGRGVRLWSTEAVERLRKIKRKTYWQGRGVKKKK